MTPLIIDTDPGIDDAFAIALATASPEVDLLAVTTVFGNVSLASTTENALRLLELCGRQDVPVAFILDRITAR
jgi:pyrimidine-specific ribonucleoside hydrolase